ncbi:hypothetical protein E0H75_29630 [Kribbella capetownensis]|uniref:Uncharacterized protein n=1 Tax=Kribbella capetownensis TaxID=1572659 RepID=A0A4R0JUI8_9ACTN|nr:hypothetical protein [Kribbella capetownensis]TCC45875.1 hypothetical protein E0H75_29630 [Kribbella capetownensis]
MAVAGGLTSLTACTDDDAGPPAPIAGIVEAADLPGSPEQEPLEDDIVAANGCTLGGPNHLQDNADHTHFVQYTLGDTVVRSYLYTYTVPADSTKDYDFLANGNKRCVGQMAPPPAGEYHLLKGLPATMTGWDAISRRDSEVVHSQRVWARRDKDTIVSVLVTRTVDKAGAEQSPSLPVDAMALATKVAAE